MRLFLALLVLLGCAAPLRAADHAAVLMYHRFGEDRIPSTNIRLEQFDAHVAELTSGRYAVLPLAEIVAKLKRGEALPDRVVAITADDAYASILTEGWPRMKKAGLPFTLFIATEPVDLKVKGYLTWDQLRQLKREGVTIGAHGHTHNSLPLMPREKAQADIARSMERFEAELGEKPALFAYPFGEWSAAVRDVVAEAGYAAGFGQHSGILHGAHDSFWLPRFPMNETYGDIKRLRQALNALPLPVSEIEPADVLVRAGAAGNPPVLRFTVAPGVERLNQMVCYTSLGGAPVKALGGNRFEVRPEIAFKPPRDRISCSVPSREEGRFRWFGIQFTVAK